MNYDEGVAYRYLQKDFGNKILCEPIKNSPPDFEFNSTVAIEVRRLNQHFVHESTSEGLEMVAFPLSDTFDEVLRSFDNRYSGKTYYVGLSFRRPLLKEIRIIKKEMKEALNNFLNMKEKDNNLDIAVNENVEFTLIETNSTEGRVFKPAGYGDEDAGGEILNIYIENINHCIFVKSKRISKVKDKYLEWWLLLVDNMHWDLGERSIRHISDKIVDKGSFSKIMIIDNTGSRLLLSL